MSWKDCPGKEHVLLVLEYACVVCIYALTYAHTVQAVETDSGYLIWGIRLEKWVGTKAMPRCRTPAKVDSVCGFRDRFLNCPCFFASFAQDSVLDINIQLEKSRSSAQALTCKGWDELTLGLLWSRQCHPTKAFSQMGREC